MRHHRGLYRPKYKNRRTDELVHSAVWWMRFNCTGCKMHPAGHGEHRESSGKTKIGEAQQELDKRRGAVASGRPILPQANKITVGELLDDVITEYKVNGRKSSEALEIRISSHVKPAYGSRPAVALSTADLNGYVAARQEDGAANATINRELAAISRGYTLGMLSGKILQKPHVPRLKENNVRRGFFEADEFAALLSKLPEAYRPMVTFMYITGWRKSEVFGLEWRNVDFLAGEIRLDAGSTKNDQARTFPMTRRLRSLLQDQRRRTDELQRDLGKIIPLVFHRNGEQRDNFYKAWKSACLAAKLAGRLVHDFRRTAVRNLVRRQISERVAMQMTGHKTRNVFERYNIVSPGDLLEAAAKLDSADSEAVPQSNRKVST